MGIRESLKGLVKKALKRPIMTVTTLGLVGLVSITVLKDNVHWGSISLNNPKKNHYAWGLLPKIKISGDNVKGNFYAIGLLRGKNELPDNSRMDGNLNSYGLFADNDVGFWKPDGGWTFDGEGAQINGNMNINHLIFGLNYISSNSEINGDMNARGLIGTGNRGEYNAHVNGNMYAHSLFFTGNNVNDDSEINGDMKARSLLFSENSVYGNSKIKGKGSNWGLLGKNRIDESRHWTNVF